MQKIATNLKYSFHSYDKLLYTNGNQSDDLSKRYEGINLLESFVYQGRLDLIKKMGSSWREIMKGDIKLTPETSQSITNLLNSHSDPDVVVFIMEKIAASNESEMIQAFFDSLEVIKNPALRDTRFKIALEKSSVPVFKLAVDSAIQRQIVQKTAAIQTSQQYKAVIVERKNQEQDEMNPAVFRPKSSDADSGDE